MTPTNQPSVASAAEPISLYLSLLKQSLLRLLSPDRYKPVTMGDLDGWGEALSTSLRERDMAIVKVNSFTVEQRVQGRDWPAEAETMIGLQRLNNLQQCVEDVLKRNIPGDFMETGVWRGGASIFLRGILRAFGVTDRKVWLADSFAGLPKPDSIRYPQDKGDLLWAAPDLAVSLDTVKANFEKYGLLDEQVAFLPGWFRDTLPKAPVSRLSILRLDGDLYESTMIALRSLYPKLSEGGYIVVDDYGALETCRSAVDDFRREFSIEEPIVGIDWSGVYWRVERVIPAIAEAMPTPVREESAWPERTTEPKFEPELQTLLDLFERRPDLKQAFPEASNWDFRRLIDWALRVTRGEFRDGNAGALRPLLRWLDSNWVDLSAGNAPPWLLLEEASRRSSNPLLRTLEVMRVQESAEIRDHLATLAMLVTEFDLKQIVELGTGPGNSTIALLEAANAIGGRVLSIDVEPCNFARSRIQSLGLDGNWRFLQRDALELGDSEIPRSIDFLFVDTFHLYTQTLAELRKFLPYMRPNGWIGLNESVSFPGVSRAVAESIRSLNRPARFYPFTHQNGLSLLRL
jgi:O-methyltransferase